MTTRSVFETFHHPDDSVWVGAKVVFELHPGSFANGVHYLGETITVLTDGAGYMQKDLWTNTDGLTKSVWTCTLPDGVTFMFYLEPGGAVSLTTLRAGGVPVTWPKDTLNSVINSAVAAHVALADPHPQYLLPAEADLVYAPIGLSNAQQAANVVFAGPTAGQAAAPTFRALVAGDIPAVDWTKITTGKPTTLGGYGIGDAYTQAQVDTALGTKANLATTLAGYGITDAYTISQSNTNLAAKANLAGGNALTGPQVLSSTAIGVVPLVARGFSGQTANLFEAQDSASVPLVMMASDGRISNDVNVTLNYALSLRNRHSSGRNLSLRGGGTWIDFFRESDGAGLGGISNGSAAGAANTLIVSGASGVALAQSGTPSFVARSGGTYALTPFVGVSAAIVPVTVQGFASQSANLTEWRDSTTALLALVDKNGGMTAAGFSTTIVSKTANYTATASDSTIQGDATGGAFTVTLPSAVGISGRIYVVKKVDGSANAVLVASAGGTIDTLATYSLDFQNEYGMFQSNGTNWLIIAN
jgi:hypothetical protein